MTSVMETGSLIKGFSTADIIAYSASSRFGLPVSDTVKRTWHDIMHVGTHLDAIQDGDYGADGQFLLGEILEYWDDPDGQLPRLDNVGAEAAISTLSDDFQELGLDRAQKQVFIQHSLEVMQATEETAQSLSIDELALARKREGSIFGQLFIDVMPEQYRHEAFPEFAEWLRCVGALSELVDSFWDMPKDARQGNIQILPSWTNRFALLRHMKPELRVISDNMTPGIVGKLAVKACLMGVNRSGKLNKYRTH